MEDIEILKQLLGGNHLEKKDLQRAKQLVNSMKVSINSRCGVEGIEGLE